MRIRVLDVIRLLNNVFKLAVLYVLFNSNIIHQNKILKIFLSAYIYDINHVDIVLFSGQQGSCLRLLPEVVGNTGLYLLRHRERKAGVDKTIIGLQMLYVLLFSRRD